MIWKGLIAGVDAGAVCPDARKGLNVGAGGVGIVTSVSRFTKTALGPRKDSGVFRACLPVVMGTG